MEVGPAPPSPASCATESCYTPCCEDSDSHCARDVALLLQVEPTRPRATSIARRVLLGGALAGVSVVLVAFGAKPAVPSLEGPLASSSLGGAQAQGVSLKVIDDEDVVDGVSCFIDSYQAVLRFANVATAIVAAEKVCAVQETENQMARCSSAVNAIIYNMVFGIGVVAASISDCAETVTPPAVCTAVFSAFIGSIATLAGTMSSATQTCSGWYWEAMRIPHNGVTTTLPPTTTLTRFRRTKRTTTPKPKLPLLPFPTLVPEAFINNNDKAKFQTSLVNCWIATGQGATFLMRAGLIIRSATKWCTPEKQVGGGTKEKTKCAVDIFAMLTAFSLATRFISLAVPACVGVAFLGDGPVGAAACAADAAGGSIGVFGTLSTGLSLKKACMQNKTAEAALPPSFFDLPEGRRLSQQEELDALGEDLAAFEEHLRGLGLTLGVGRGVGRLARALLNLRWKSRRGLENPSRFKRWSAHNSITTG